MLFGKGVKNYQKAEGILPQRLLRKAFANPLGRFSKNLIKSNS